MKRFTILLAACVVALALTTTAEARLAGGKCSAKAYQEYFVKKTAEEQRKYNVEYPKDYVTCANKLYKPFFDQHCPKCGVDSKCIAKSTARDFVEMSQNKKEVVDYALSVFENPDCSAAFVPMYVKAIRLVQKLGRAPTEDELLLLLYPGANHAKMAADMKEMGFSKMLGEPVNQDRDDDELGKAKGWRKHAQAGLKVWDAFWASPYGKHAAPGMPGGKIQGINKFRPNYDPYIKGPFNPRDEDEAW